MNKLLKIDIKENIIILNILFIYKYIYWLFCLRINNIKKSNQYFLYIPVFKYTLCWIIFWTYIFKEIQIQ